MSDGIATEFFGSVMNIFMIIIAVTFFAILTERYGVLRKAVFSNDIQQAVYESYIETDINRCIKGDGVWAVINVLPHNVKLYIDEVLYDLENLDMTCLYKCIELNKEYRLKYTYASDGLLLQVDINEFGGV